MKANTVKKGNIYYITVTVQSQSFTFPIVESHIYNAVLDDAPNKAHNVTQLYMHKYKQKIPRDYDTSFYTELRKELIKIMDKHSQLLGL